MMSCLLNQKPVSHTGTFLRQELANGKVKIIYYDPNENHMFEKGDHWLDYKKIFGRFQLITIYELKGRPFKNAAEKEYINKRMKYIMTGEKDEEFIKSKQIEQQYG